MQEVIAAADIMDAAEEEGIKITAAHMRKHTAKHADRFTRARAVRSTAKCAEELTMVRTVRCAEGLIAEHAAAYTAILKIVIWEYAPMKEAVSIQIGIQTEPVLQAGIM